MIVRRTQELQSGVLSARVRHDDSVILDLNTQAVDYALDGRRLALLSAWNGSEEVAVDGRRVIVDDDSWLLANGGPASVRIRAAHNVHAMTILFRQGMPEEVLGALTTPDDHMLEDGETGGAQLPFTPHLRTHDRSVTPVLLFIRRHCEMGLEDGLWYEEQLAFLLERLLINHRHLLAKARQIPVRRASTRREILRRISLATDFIHTSYAKPLMLSDMAGAAFLSRHHFLRLFKQIHEVTPHEYLQRKRTSVAARLLRNSQRQVDEVVKEVGFDSRSTLFRALRRFHGLTPRECRHAAEAPVFMGHMTGTASGWVSADGTVSRMALAAQH